MLPGGFHPWILLDIPVFHLTLLWKRNSENYSQIGIPEKRPFPNLRFGSKSCQEHLEKPKFTPSSAVSDPGIIPNPRPVQKGWKRETKKAESLESNTGGAACCPGPGPAQPRSCHRGQHDSEEVNQKSPGWSQLLGWAGMKSLGSAGSWIPELSAGNGSLGCAESGFEGHLGKKIRPLKCAVLALGVKKKYVDEFG